MATPALRLAISNTIPTFTSIVESDPQDIIFDMDGTLADVSHRKHFVENNPKNWEAFYKAMINDKPNSPVIMIARLQ